MREAAAFYQPAYRPQNLRGRMKKPRPPRTEAEILDIFHQLDKTGQDFLELMVHVMADLQGRPAESKLFLQWLAANRFKQRKPQRSTSELLVVLRTGAWRNEMRRAARRRVIKLVGAR
jgi:hypothetical protein